MYVLPAEPRPRRSQVPTGQRRDRDGHAGGVPAGLANFTNAGIEAARLDQMTTVVSSIDNSELFMWVIVTAIVAALVHVTALEHTRDSAVIKAPGASSGHL
jgi:hypothetical protein